jgi:hypothetical protein
MAKSRPALTLEQHKEIASDLNQARRLLEKTLITISTVKPVGYKPVRLLLKMIGGASNLLNSIRSQLEDDMFAHHDRHPDMPEGMEATKIYYPGDYNIWRTS